MKINEIISFLESIAHPSLQESYDNAGLLTGDRNWDCTGIICCLDTTEEVVKEAVLNKCNCIVSHHPVIFRGLKKINGDNDVEKTIISAIKNDIAIYAIHTNLDNVIAGVNGAIAGQLGLKNTRILFPKENTLKKLFTFVPRDHAETIRKAIFDAGGGQIGQYSECSFNVAGTGTFKPGEGSNPYAGKQGERHQEEEIRIEVIFPSYLEGAILKAMRAVHPYEEVAFDLIGLVNTNPETGSGLIGELPEALEENQFLAFLKKQFKTPLIRHSPLLKKKIRNIAICGGTGSFLIHKALHAGADAFITADLKYHEFFEANNRMLLADIGHFESEQFTISLLQEQLQQKFPTFAILKTAVETNPVRYFS